jgi:hypothetical protein
MVKVFQGTKHEYYMDGYLQRAFDIAKKEIKNDWDFLFVYDGMEGSGKSVKAMQDAFYCDPDLSIKQYAFNHEQFKAAVLGANKFQAIVYDEAHSGLNSRAAMSSVNRSLVSMLTEIRQKNLFVFIILPTFFDLDKYVAIWRSRALIHVYTSKSFERGYFSFYNIDKKKMLYVKGKKFYQYGVIKPNFIGRFTNHYPLDKEEYKKLKYEAFQSRDKDVTAEAEAKALKELLWKYITDIDSLSHRQKYEILKMPESTYFGKLRKLKEIKGFSKEIAFTMPL